MNNKVYLRLASLYKIEYECEMKNDDFYFKGICNNIRCDYITDVPEYIKHYFGSTYKEDLECEFIEKFYNEIKTLQAKEFVKTLNIKEQKLILRHLYNE